MFLVVPNEIINSTLTLISHVSQYLPTYESPYLPIYYNPLPHHHISPQDDIDGSSDEEDDQNVMLNDIDDI